MRAINSGISLNEKDAGIVKGMLKRGDRQHDIASWFGVNGGRIAEVSVGKTFPDILPKSEGLPPRGPYLSGMDMMRIKQKIKFLERDISLILRKIDKENLNQFPWLVNDISFLKSKVNDIHNEI